MPVLISIQDDSLLGKIDEATQQKLTKYKLMVETVKNIRNDVLEYQRLASEMGEQDARIKNLVPEVNARDKELEDAAKSVDCISGEIGDLREMFESSKRWRDTALKIALLREQVLQKEDDFRIMNNDKHSRDLKKVTDDIAELERKKDECMEKINALNKEMSKINDDVASLSQTATRLETNYRNMQEKYNEELKMEERKSELNIMYADLKTEYEQVSRNHPYSDYSMEMFTTTSSHFIFHLFKAFRTNRTFEAKGRS
jgi:chromosome segregation ATPase